MISACGVPEACVCAIILRSSVVASRRYLHAVAGINEIAAWL